MPELRICAYNVLAQTLATSSFFPYASAYLKRATRLPRTLARIRALDADVLCLSEAYPDVVSQVEASGYGVLWIAFKRLASSASAAEKTALFSGTARRVYSLA